MSRSITVLVHVFALAIEVVDRHSMVLAAMTGENLVVAVAIDVSDPEGMPLGQSIVDHTSRAKL